MLRTRLLTATAAIALFASPAAFAQEVPAQTMPEAAQTEAIQATETPAESASVIDVLKGSGQFNTLLEALDATQLTETLQTRPAISIFAPTDAAFAALSEEDRERLLDPANVNELRQTLLYHVIVADVNSSQIQGAKGGVETAATTQVLLDGTGDQLKIDDATIVQADLDAANGAVFAIDKVLNPANSMAAMGDEEAVAPADADAAVDEALPADEAVTDEAPVVDNPADPAEATPPVDEPTDEETAPVPTDPVV